MNKTPLKTLCGIMLVSAASLPLGIWALLPGALSAQTVGPGYYVSGTGNDSWSGQLPSPNAEHTDGPFLTLTRAQRAMQASPTVKTTYIRAGTYSPAPSQSGDGCNYNGSVSINLVPADYGETWSYYPPDGYNSAIIDGGSPHIPQTGPGGPNLGSGTGCAFGDDYASNVTIIGLQFQNYRYGALWVNGPSNITFTDNIVHDTTVATTGADAINLNCSPGSVISNNYIYNVAYFAISLAATSNCPGGINDTVVSGNYILNSCTWASNPGSTFNDTDGGDCATIYTIDMASPKATNIKIINNYLRDVNASSGGHGDFGNCCTFGIYLDGPSFNVTVAGNIVTGIESGCFDVHGANDHLFNNICDLGSLQALIVTNTVWDSAANFLTTGNTFENNIVVANNSSYGGNGYRGQGFGPEIAPIPMTIQNNAYFNYGGPGISLNSDGQQTSDSNPVYENPNICCWAPAISGGSVFNAPVSFPGITGGWGPPGFVIPQTGTPPSWPALGSSGSGPIANGIYTIRNHSSGLVLDDPGNAPPGAQVIQYGQNNPLTANQRWVLTYNASQNAYTIVNQSSGGFLTDTASASLRTVPVPLPLYENYGTGDASQLWTIASGSGAYVVTNVATGRVMDDPAASTLWLVGIITYPPNGGTNQGWLFQ